MKVAFPTNNEKTIASHIALAKGFLVVDTKSNEKFFIPNPIREENIPKDEPRGLGAGRIIPEILADAGVDIFIARDIGEGMAMNLQRFGIEPKITENKNIDEVIENLSDTESIKFDYGYEFRRGLGYHRFGRGFGRRFGLRNGGFGRGYGFCRGNGFGRGFGRRFWD